jgi:hypothetical protein
VAALVGGVAAAQVVVVLAPSPAAAAPPSCATAPAAYTGTDATVAAITQLTIDSDVNCLALAGRVDALDGDVRGGNTQAHTDAQAIDADVGAITTKLASWTTSNPLEVALPAGGSGQAVQVTNFPADQTVALDTGSSAQFDGQSHSTHNDLWVLIGVIVGTFSLGEVLRRVFP